MVGLRLAFVTCGDGLGEQVHATTRKGRRRIPMLNVLQRSGVARTVMMSVLFVLAVCGTAMAQETVQVTGTVTSGTTGEKLWGASVRVKNAAIQTLTDQQGRYSITAPTNGVLTFALIGYRGTEQPVNGRSTIDVAMEQAPTTTSIVDRPLT